MPAAVTSDFDGTGVGVAIIDSGITDWHDDLARATGRNGLNGQRVSGFVDFVGGAPRPRDGYGHGTHVAGIIAGNGLRRRRRVCGRRARARSSWF